MKIEFGRSDIYFNLAAAPLALACQISKIKNE